MQLLLANRIVVKIQNTRNNQTKILNIHVGQNCIQTNKIICIRFDVVFTVTIHSIFHSFPAGTFSRVGWGGFLFGYLS